jgi:hypothetical protein
MLHTRSDATVNMTLPGEVWHLILWKCLRANITNMSRWQLVSRQMRELALNYTTYFPGGRYVSELALPAYRALKSLTIYGRKGIIFDLSILATVASTLTELTVDGYAQLTDAHVKPLYRLDSLSYYPFEENTTFTDEGLASLTRLTSVGLTQATAITGRGLSLKSQLSFLSLEKMPHITDDAIWPLTKLEYLTLETMESITDACLTTLVNLTTLSLTDTAMTGRCMESLQKLHTLELSVMDFFDFTCPLPSLSHLEAGDCPSLRDNSFAFLTALRSLTIYEMPQITDNVIPLIGNVKRLYLSTTGVTCAQLYQLTALRSLDLRMELDQWALNPKMLTQIEELWIGSASPVPLIALEDMISLKKLCIRRIQGSGFTEVHINRTR